MTDDPVSTLLRAVPHLSRTYVSQSVAEFLLTESREPSFLGEGAFKTVVSLDDTRVARIFQHRFRKEEDPEDPSHIPTPFELPVRVSRTFENGTIVEIMDKLEPANHHDAEHIDVVLGELGLQWNDSKALNAGVEQGPIRHIRIFDGSIIANEFLAHARTYTAHDYNGELLFRIAAIGTPPGPVHLFQFDPDATDITQRYKLDPELVHCFIDAPSLTGVWLRYAGPIFGKNIATLEEYARTLPSTTFHLEDGLTPLIRQAATDRTNDRHRVLLARSDHEWMRYLAATTAVADSLLAILADDVSPRIREQVARRATHDYIRERLLHDPELEVRMAVAEHARSDSLRAAYATDPSVRLRMAAIGAMQTDTGRASFLNDESEYVVDAVLRTAESDALRERVVKDPRKDIRASALRHAKTDALRRKFLHDEDRDIRSEACTAIENVDILEEALHHANFLDRRALRSRINDLREMSPGKPQHEGPALS